MAASDPDLAVRFLFSGHASPRALDCRVEETAMIVAARRCSIAIAVLLLLCPRAYAESFTVTLGMVNLPTALGSATFTLGGDNFSFGGHIPQSVGGFTCFPCPASRQITLAGPLSDSSFGGNPGSFAGVDYPAIFLTGLMQLRSPSFPASMLFDSLTVTLPFELSAFLSGYRTGSDAFNGINPIFSGDFAGTGTVTARFHALPVDPGQEPLFDFASASYVVGATSVEPTPEPATLLLFSVGAMSVFFHRRKR
jgi:hypothetical protein